MNATSKPGSEDFPKVFFKSLQTQKYTLQNYLNTSLWNIPLPPQIRKINKSIYKNI